jgi:hypothetical protein
MMVSSNMWLPNIKPLYAGFFQSRLRKEPPFYLCTRFFSMCRQTGATHVFRIKCDTAIKTVYKDCEKIEVVKFKHDTTAGYLGWLLKHMWKHNGLTRPDSATFRDDIYQVCSYGKFYANVKVYCAELEQALLRAFFEKKLRDFYLYAAQNVGLVKEDAKEFFANLCNALIGSNSAQFFTLD